MQNVSTALVSKKFVTSNYYKVGICFKQQPAALRDECYLICFCLAKMVLKSDQERVKALLSETITLLCRNGLHFQSELSIEALIGITLDHEDVFLVSVKEIIQPNSNPNDSPNSLDMLRKQKLEDVETIQLDADPGDLSRVSDSTPAGSGTNLSHCASQQLTFYSENTAGEKVTEAQKKKRRRTIDTNSDSRAIESTNPGEGHAFSRSRIEAQTGSDVLVESSSSLSNPERVGAQSDGKEAFLHHEETGTKSDIFSQDFGTDVIHIKEEAFSMDDGMQYYNPSESFSAYPSHYQGTTNDANPFDTAGHPFQVSEESASHLVNEMHSQVSIQMAIITCKKQSTYMLRLHICLSSCI